MRKYVWLLCALVCLTACEYKEKGPHVEMILYDKAIDLVAGDTRKLNVLVTPPMDSGVKWSSDNEEVATVKKGVVTAVAEGEAVITISYGELSAACTVTVAAKPKVGDYFYADGTWSDGGLVSIETDGRNPVWAERKPEPVEGKTVVGIVFQTVPARISEKDAKAGRKRGYVMALRFAHAEDKVTTPWSTDTKFSCLKGVKRASAWYKDIDGYTETTTVRDTYKDKMEMMPAFDRTLNGFLPEAPENTSGWFLPGAGQLWDMAANLCGHEAAEYLKKWQGLSGDVTAVCSEKVTYDIAARFNEVMSAIPAADKEVLTVSGEEPERYALWASTPYDDKAACVLVLGTDGTIECNASQYATACYARPILAF